MIHSTVPPYQVNKATTHATMDEFRYIWEGQCELWRDDCSLSSITTLKPGTSFDIPAKTLFQNRNTYKSELEFICITMPPWSGDSDAVFLMVKGSPRLNESHILKDRKQGSHNRIAPVLVVF